MRSQPKEPLPFLGLDNVDLAAGAGPSAHTSEAARGQKRARSEGVSQDEAAEHAVNSLDGAAAAPAASGSAPGSPLPCEQPSPSGPSPSAPPAHPLSVADIFKVAGEAMDLDSLPGFSREQRTTALNAPHALHEAAKALGVSQQGDARPAVGKLPEVTPEASAATSESYHEQALDEAVCCLSDGCLHLSCVSNLCRHKCQIGLNSSLSALSGHCAFSGHDGASSCRRGRSCELVGLKRRTT